MSDIVKKETGAVVVHQVDEQTIKDYLFGSNTKLSEQQQMLFMQTAVNYNLDPFKREIYAIPYVGKLSIITGFEVYLKRADRSGKLDGWRVWVDGSKKDGTLKACIEIKRKDWNDPFIHDVYFEEYVQGTPIWKSKPITMIKKVVMAQGFRLAFPDELGGIPYTADELPPEMGTPEDPKVTAARENGEKIQKDFEADFADLEVKETISRPTSVDDSKSKIKMPEKVEWMSHCLKDYEMLEDEFMKWLFHITQDFNKAGEKVGRGITGLEQITSEKMFKMLKWKCKAHYEAIKADLDTGKTVNVDKYWADHKAYKVENAKK